MHALLVGGTTLAGLLAGGALDPLGQHLADLSQVADERRRAVEQPAATDAGDELEVPAPPRTVVPNLLPAGRSSGRTWLSALVTGALFGAAAGHFGPNLILAPYCVFFALLVVLSITDLSHRLVPRHLVYAASSLIVPLLVATSAVDDRWSSLIGSAIAGAVAFGVFFGLWWFVPRGMGFGDVRLAGVIGVTVGYLSLLHAYIAFLAGFVIGALFGVGAMAAASSGRRTQIPFAPSLAGGAVVAVLLGGPLARGLFHAGG